MLFESRLEAALLNLDGTSLNAVSDAVIFISCLRSSVIDT
jgi:hypothetical protein